MVAGMGNMGVTKLFTQKLVHLFIEKHFPHTGIHRRPPKCAK